MNASKGKSNRDRPVKGTESVFVVKAQKAMRQAQRTAARENLRFGLPLIVQGTYVCASAILTEAILSFLGAGINPEIPTWGNIMAEGRALCQVKPFIVFFPAVFLSITVLAVNLLGDGLRDALDPRLAKRI